MKDATGELSMTAVAVVAIAAIAALFSTLIWPTIITNIMRSTYCSGAFDCDCTGATGGGELCTCYYCPTDGGQGTNSATDFDTDCADKKEIKCSANNVN